MALRVRPSRLQKKRVTAEREAYYLTLRTLEGVRDGASPQDIEALKVQLVDAKCSQKCSQ